MNIFFFPHMLLIKSRYTAVSVAIAAIIGSILGNIRTLSRVSWLALVNLIYIIMSTSAYKVCPYAESDTYISLPWFSVLRLLWVLSRPFAGSTMNKVSYGICSPWLGCQHWFDHSSKLARAYRILYPYAYAIKANKNMQIFARIIFVRVFRDSKHVLTMREV